MSLNSVTLGIHSENLNSTFWILKLIAKNAWFVDEEGNRVKWNGHDHDHVDDWEDTDFEIQLHDDLIKEGATIANLIRIFTDDIYDLKLTYVKNKKITDEFCSEFMIHLASINSSGESHEISEEDMRDLYEWRKELISSGRLPENAKVKMIGDR